MNDVAAPAPLRGDLPERGPFVPARYRLAQRRQETDDIVSMVLEPADQPIAEPRPGQFNMLTAFGVGEIAISWSGVPGSDGTLRHTIRDVGHVSHVLCTADVGDLIGVRGPFGNDWAVDSLAGQDAVVVAGGIGLAPLLGAVTMLVRRQLDGAGRCFLAVGARTPGQILFGRELDQWRRDGAEVRVSVDAAERGWTGSVGLVTQLLPDLGFDPDNAVAFVCGPEVMIRFSARALVERGVAPERIRVSLERNMQCGIGLCGHCQLGPYLLCRDGPIVEFAGAVPSLVSGHER